MLGEGLRIERHPPVESGDVSAGAGCSKDAASRPVLPDEIAPSPRCSMRERPKSTVAGFTALTIEECMGESLLSKYPSEGVGLTASSPAVMGNSLPSGVTMLKVPGSSPYKSWASSWPRCSWRTGWASPDSRFTSAQLLPPAFQRKSLSIAQFRGLIDAACGYADRAKTAIHHTIAGHWPTVVNPTNVLRSRKGAGFLELRH